MFALFALVAFGACDESTDTRSEVDVDCTISCGDNGSCSSDGTFCICDAGFVDTGVGCEIVACSSDSDCSNGNACDGAEICNTTENTCMPGTPTLCRTGEICAPDTGSCGCSDGSVDVDGECEEIVCNDDSDCDNGLACDGVEVCDQDAKTCSVGTPITCGSDATCDEELDACSCDDGFVAQGDACVAVVCTTDDDCDNQLHCDGVESCDQDANACVTGDSVTCDDGQICSNRSASCECPFGTVDIGNGCEPVSCASDSDCDDGDPCNGAETCNVDQNRCEVGTAVECGEFGDCVANEEIATCACDDGATLDDGLCAPICAVPQAFTVDVVMPVDDMVFSVDDELGLEIAIVDPSTPADEIEWTVGNTAMFNDVSGSVRVLARVSDASCIPVDSFATVVDVRTSYAPAAGQEGTTAIAAADERIVAWATGHSDVSYGEEVADNWKTPEKAYGSVAGGSFGVVVLGRGGSITMTFDAPIRDGDGPDFAVFENGFSDTFLELGYAEVSSDGVTFERFDVLYAGTTPVGGFGAMDPTQFTGFAGKYRSGFGTPFDLNLLKNRPAVRNGTVDLSAITHVRIVDVIGAGGADGYEAELDALGRIIYDLYPTVGSSGFDLSGIGVLNEQTD